MHMDFESWKDFMAEQQAQFWADLRAIGATQAETARLMDEDRQRIAEDRQRRDRPRIRELTSAQRELAASHAHSDQRLDALINVVEALVKRNGKHE